VVQGEVCETCAGMAVVHQTRNVVVVGRFRRLDFCFRESRLQNWNPVDSVLTDTWDHVN
jgi:hypothetical protein